jgi:hypothetical protein
MPLPFASYLINIACSRDLVPATPAAITDPAEFLTLLFRYIAVSNAPITRLGMDQMMDALFAHPEMAPALEDNCATDIQNRFEAVWLPQTSPLFKAHWAHIILPAWAQHCDIHRACMASGTATDSATTGTASTDPPS